MHETQPLINKDSLCFHFFGTAIKQMTFASANDFFLNRQLDQHWIYPFSRETWCAKGNVRTHQITDYKGDYLSYDQLMGLLKQWRKCRSRYFKRKWSLRKNGRKNSVYGGHRRPRTHQERTLSFNASDQDCDYRIKVRRSAASIPTAWDDICRHVDKSWKTQAKRQCQWRGSSVRGSHDTIKRTPYCLFIRKSKAVRRAS